MDVQQLEMALREFLDPKVDQYPDSQAVETLYKEYSDDVKAGTFDRRRNWVEWCVYSLQQTLVQAVNTPTNLVTGTEISYTVTDLELMDEQLSVARHHLKNVWRVVEVEADEDDPEHMTFYTSRMTIQKLTLLTLDCVEDALTAMREARWQAFIETTLSAGALCATAIHYYGQTNHALKAGSLVDSAYVEGLYAELNPDDLSLEDAIEPFYASEARRIVGCLVESWGRSRLVEVLAREAERSGEV